MDRINAIRAHYERRMLAGRENFDVLDWASAASQRRRFEVFVESVPLVGKRLLDVGCGLGDLAAFLDERGIEADYTGVDVLDRMVQACRQRFGSRRFLRADVLGGERVEGEPFDVAFSSGIFNLDLGNNLAFVAAAVPRLLELAGEHAAFNLLHARSPHQEEGYYFYDPAEVLRLIPPGTCEVRLLDDYLPNDFTVICRKLPAEGD